MDDNTFFICLSVLAVVLYTLLVLAETFGV